MSQNRIAGVLDFPKRKKKCAVVGFTIHREEALKLPAEEWDLFGLNELYRFMPINRFVKWFELHDFSVLDQDPDHVKALTQFPIPVYMQDHYDKFPSSVALPKAEIEQHFPGGEYQTSSISWMVAQALLDGYEEIAIFGVDMAQDTEYAEQRPCAEYWLGLARGMGVKAWVPQTSDLLKTIGQYGFGTVGSLFHAKIEERLRWLHGEHNQILAEMRRMNGEHEKSEAAYKQRMEQLNLMRVSTEGGIQDCTYWKRSWSVPGAADQSTLTPDRSKDPRTGITEQPTLTLAPGAVPEPASDTAAPTAAPA